ncbi:arsenate reductase family protein [Tumebacillus sp. ITR2]|uniref:Arsenate reductase family protein n=1 Tax=Tumebacillus amylolyticus TaxID=2801339 RepID=A0ABS1J8D7_9BACL|nr:arsenate reductase family protein [Tumebacillus amylolyticus]MBL0386465.1 arsenate reductase family protein [Tumebacillus amylolyticus]
MAEILFYEYPKCGTCRNAKKYLDANGIEYEDIHIVENSPTIEQLRDYLEKSGLEIKKFFNTSGNKYKELGLKDKLKDMSVEEQLNLLASDGMLIKRPILVRGDKATVGFKEEEFQKVLG